jgi:DNA cross-link repair 1C protein
MSSFPGKIREYDFVSMDRFNNENLRSSMFFLSHCHQDHMEGLDDPLFVALLKDKKLKLYCHEITAALLLCDSRYFALATHIVRLQVNQTYSLDIPYAETINADSDTRPNCISVSVLPAHHCPGSVMYFIEGVNGAVLYTGDFRLAMSDIQQMAPFKLGSSSGLKEIETMYLDTTFCCDRTLFLPSRETSLEEILTHSNIWLNKSSMHKVLIYTASKYGHEFLLCGLHKKFKQKIHVPKWKMNAYQAMPTILNCVTTDPTSTRIHACCYWDLDNDPEGRKVSGCCAECSPGDTTLLTIKPSVMFFQTAKCKQIVKWESANYLRICYSMHSSFDEIKNFVSYLNPKQLRPNVIPKGSSEGQVMSLLNGIVARRSTTAIITNNTTTKTLPFSTNEFVSLRRQNCLKHIDSSDDEDFCGEPALKIVKI